MFFAPIMVWLLTPSIHPFKWSRLLFTYRVPLIPLVALIDGVVSALRTYTPDELREMADSLDADGYTWEIDALPIGKGPLAVTSLIGYPRS